MKKTFVLISTIIAIIFSFFAGTVVRKIRLESNEEIGQVISVPVAPVERTHVLFDTEIDPVWLKPCDEQGTTEEVNFISKEGYDRRAVVYLPYGYDETKHYDVIILLHGDGGTQHEWIDSTHYGKVQWQMKDLYDNMIKNDLCDPFIVISPQYLNWAYGASYDTFGKEIVNTLLPQLAEKYATYAENGDFDSLVAARDHFTIGGLSRGAMYTYWSAMIDCTPVIKNYLIMSEGGPDPKVYEHLQNDPNEVNLYISMGQYDNVSRSKLLYDGFLNQTTKFQNGNIHYEVLNGMGHYWPCWTTSIFNAIQIVDSM